MQKRSALFRGDIDTWEKWSEAFTDIELFRPLILHIFETHGISIREISNLEPGTNAVFRCDDYVIKIFAPEEIIGGFPDSSALEIYLTREAAKLGINTPDILFFGTAADRYCFRYAVMKYLKGEMIRDYILHSDDEEKIRLVDRIQDITKKLRSIPFSEKAGYPDLPHDSDRWKKVNSSLSLCMKKIRDEYSFAGENVYVHGDLTGENILIDGERTGILDFGDAHYGPSFYEYPSLLIEGFSCDDLMCRRYIDIESNGGKDFTDRLLNGLAIHDFGEELILSFFEKKGIDPLEVKTAGQLKDFFEKYWVK